MQGKIVPDVVEGQELIAFQSSTTVIEATKEMASQNIGAVLVIENSKLVGIFTERDIAQRIVARGRDPQTTPLGEVMTANPDTLKPDDTIFDALELFNAKRYRHLPVLDGDLVVGMVSMRDLFKAVQSHLERDLAQRDHMIFDTGYGTGTG